ncbi:MAG: Zn-dependent hydrolase [Acidobacteriota bacterium]|nr:Zn-dependent hydrolase [Acidobacteriota bacterium]
MVRFSCLGFWLSFALTLPAGAQGLGEAQAPPDIPALRQARPTAGQRAPRVESRTPRNAGGRPVHNEAERASLWKTVRVPYDKTRLTAREQQMVAKLADACRLMDKLYWHQSDLGGYAMYHTTQSAVMGKLFSINGSRWDLVDENFPMIGEEPMMPGRELYPFGLTRTEVEQYSTKHPAEKAAIYSPWTVVRSAPLDLDPKLSQPVVYNVPEKLYTYPYHEAYAQWLKPMADDLRAAAKLSGDRAFAHYLNLRADALLSDDYYASDIAWLELKDPKVDLIFAPYETYLDGLLGVKTSYGASILIRNDAESRKLAMYQKREAAMQQALPVAAEIKPSKEGYATPMEVADAPLRAGDLRYGYQAVADNLPNDPRVHAEKGSKKIFFKNFMDLRLNDVILPVAAKMLAGEQLKDVNGEGYLTSAILHEISHGLGPAFAQIGGKQVPINEAIGPAYSGLEEAKADVTGIFLAKWLVDQKLLAAAELDNIYGSYVAGIFRTLRFGTGEAHGRAEMMEFNYLLEHNTLSQGLDGRYTIDYAAMPGTIEELCKTLLMFEANGDRAGTEAWLAKYDVMPQSLTLALDATTGIPVDVTPDFELSNGVRP